VVPGELGRFPLWISSQVCAVQYWAMASCSVGQAPEMVMEAKMMAKYKYRSWYMKIHASKHRFGYIME